MAGHGFDHYLHLLRFALFVISVNLNHIILEYILFFAAFKCAVILPSISSTSLITYYTLIAYIFFFSLQTSIMAVEFADGVVLGADSRTTTG